MTDHPEPALLTQARNVFEADVIVGILDEAGIPSYRSGGQLTDGFAMSQQLMNLQGVRVYVPENRLEDAQKTLREANEQGRILAESEAPDSEDPDAKNPDPEDTDTEHTE